MPPSTPNTKAQLPKRLDAQQPSNAVFRSILLEFPLSLWAMASWGGRHLSGKANTLRREHPKNAAALGSLLAVDSGRPYLCSAASPVNTLALRRVRPHAAPEGCTWTTFLWAAQSKKRGRAAPEGRDHRRDVTLPALGVDPHQRPELQKSPAHVPLRRERKRFMRWRGSCLVRPDGLPIRPPLV
jgi:hypothetical protein